MTRKKSKLKYKKRRRACKKLPIQETGTWNTTNAIIVEDSNEYIDDKVTVSETIISGNQIYIKDDTEDYLRKETESFVTGDAIKTEMPTETFDNVNSDVQIKEEIDISNVKLQFGNCSLFCDNCQAYYEDYCTTCGMLCHILNNIVDDGTGNTSDEIPRNILEIQNAFGNARIVSRKVIPKGVKFGPFTGLSSESSLKLKQGKFVMNKRKSKVLNWMHNINPARDISEQNLRPFLCGNDLYYRSTCQIKSGEELLVYFGKEYEDSFNKDMKMEFTPTIENDVEDVFACILCCLGFTSKSYLDKHKIACPHKTTERFSTDELMQCRSCNVYIWQNEYFQYHMASCFEVNVRQSVNLEAENRIESPHSEVQLQSQRIGMNKLKCTTCEFRTTYISNLYKHVRSMHLKVCDYKCELCDYKTSYKKWLDVHTKTKHPKNLDTKCKVSNDNQNSESRRKIRGRTKHLNEVHFKCTYCDHKTNWKTNLSLHIKTQHHKEFKYNCNICKYKTNNKPCLESHTKAKHLNEYSYACDFCSEYKTNKKGYLEIHVKTKHLKIFDYKCSSCNYETNYKPNLELHVKTKHLKKFDYKCVLCNYATNLKDYLEIHVKNNHLKEFDYTCDTCQFMSNNKVTYENHIKTKHIKKFDYECEMCSYNTNLKQSYKQHIETKHLNKFDYACDTCEYKTHQKCRLKFHLKTVHLKESVYKCEKCYFGTNRRSNYVEHIMDRHFEDFEVEYNVWENKTTYKDYLDEKNYVKIELIKEFINLKLINKNK